MATPVADPDDLLRFWFEEHPQDWFAKNRPGVKTVLRAKKLGWATDEPELWQEIKGNGGNAVVIGVGG